MKLCFIVNQMYKSGGIEKALTSRLKELSSFYEIYLITLENGNRDFYFGRIENIIHLDLDLNFNRKSNGGFKLNFGNISKSLSSYLKLQKVLIKIRPDFTINVVGVHSFYFLSYIGFTGKTILEYHSSLYENPPSNFKKYITNKFDYHVFLNKEECNIASFINKNKYIIPNPAQINNIEKKPYSNKSKRIIAAGRIVDVKGFDRLVKAWEIIYKEFPDWIVEVYGEPDLVVLNKIQKMIYYYRLENSFFIKGADTSILDIINDSKIYAMTSHFESFSIVVLEAISLGTLVIAFDCPTGPRNIIDKESGYLIENDDIELYAQALKEAILNESNSEILANNGYKKSQVFSLDKIIEKWKNLFSNKI